jgi:HEAT repeat protein
MKTSSLVFKREILQAAGENGGSISVQLLTGALADDNTEVMGEAMGALAPYGRAILHDAMAAAMKRCSGVALRRNIAEAGGWKDPGVVDILGPYVQDGDPSVRLAVAVALKENGTAGAVPLLAELLNDPVAEVRHGALSRITGIPWGYCGDALRDTLNHPDIEMARKAARKLCEIYDGAVEPILASALEHSDPEVRFVAAEGLLKGKSPRGVPAMDELIRQGVFSSDGVKALKDHGGEEGLEALLRYMPEAPPQHRNMVIQVFSTQRCQKAVPILEEYFGKSTGSERINTAKALEFQGWKPKNLEQAREFFQLIGNSEVLAEMGAPEAVQPLLQRAMRTTSDQELITCCRLLARNENSSATNALVSLLKAKKWNQAIFPAQQLIRMDTLGALQGLVDHIFGPSPVHSVEREAVSKAGGGIVRLILNRTRNSLSAEKAVKLLSEILRNRPSIVSHADLVFIASLSVSAVVMKTTEEACTVVLKRTNQIKPLNCDEVKRLAAEELAARKTNG